MTRPADALTAGDFATPPMPRPHATELLVGSMVVLLVAILARFASSHLAGIPDVVWALIAGLTIRNLAYRRLHLVAGLTVHYVLRVAIILLGSSLALGQAFTLELKRWASSWRW